MVVAFAYAVYGGRVETRIGVAPAIDCHARIGSATPFKELEPRSR